MAALKNQGKFFSSVKVARERLRERADEIINEYFDIAGKAKDAGDYETAGKMIQWLIDHMPSEDDGTKVIDVSVDKVPSKLEQEHRPAIQIGISLGGVANPPKALPKATVIDSE